MKPEAFCQEIALSGMPAAFPAASMSFMVCPSWGVVEDDRRVQHRPFSSCGVVDPVGQLLALQAPGQRLSASSG